ncbi:DUF4349 domain-containing protein [Microbacterium sp. cf332]|uniref:DUF4349 domain-containing protein n=1 Tax=Microbacterium sp. cf332 TaxID=1761804 RepID=UPI0008845C8E|nr:DUF4349 domain-containing protein [Microbacterium sp. cf332]SDQ12407.1 protein of unknown function [Microbacterium sp. cf332]
MNDLPILDERRIDEIEEALFADIARERIEQRARDAADAAIRRRRRRTWWGVSGTAAAVLVVAAVVAPQLSATTGGAGGAVAPATAPDWSAGSLENGTETRSDGGVDAEAAPFSAGVDENGAGSTELGRSDGREVVATASATLTVDDPRSAAESIADAATAAGGYVESMSVGGADATTTPDGAAMWPMPSGAAWITVRVPADGLEDLIDGLADAGDVESSQVARDDVTTQAVDLRARVAAGQASVDRLTALVGEAASVTDLIAAESALAARQADLESLQQQLSAIESQVDLSSLTVQLVAPAERVDADPAGFGDGLAAGWNGLVASFNGIVVALGFLLPWLLVMSLVASLVWLIVTTTRRRRNRRDPRSS